MTVQCTLQWQFLCTSFAHGCVEWGPYKSHLGFFLPSLYSWSFCCLNKFFSFGAIHKWRLHWVGEEGSPKSRLKEHNQRISVCDKGEGGKKIPKFFQTSFMYCPFASAEMTVAGIGDVRSSRYKEGRRAHICFQGTAMRHFRRCMCPKYGFKYALTMRDIPGAK